MRRARLAQAAALITLLTLDAVRPARAEPSCGDLLVVYDRSGSMAQCSIDGVTKEEMAKKAMKSVFSSFATTPMGLLARRPRSS